MKTNSMYDKTRWKKKKKKRILSISADNDKWLIYNVVSSLENIAKKIWLLIAKYLYISVYVNIFIHTDIKGRIVTWWLLNHCATVSHQFFAKKVSFKSINEFATD